MFKDINVLLGVTGGIACYKSCEIVSRLKKLGAIINVVMTKHATEFVMPLTFETLSSNEVIVDMFAPKKHYEVEHISLAKKTNLCIIAPASADIIAKLADGICDDMLTTTVLALRCPILIAPAMNTNMYLNPITVENINKLKSRGFIFIDSIDGNLACGDKGLGKMAEPIDIVNKAKEIIFPVQDYSNKTVLITAGATREPIDPVRFITNRSSGKMGVEIAKEVVKRGGKVILVKGITSCDIPMYLDNIVDVQTTNEMYDAVMENMKKADIIIKAAAPSDYRVEKMATQKIKSQDLVLNLVKNPDIAKAVGQNKGDKKLVIFSAETENLQENANKKIKSKNADMVIANDVSQKGAGFDVDTNIITIIKKDSSYKEYPLMKKSNLASIILDEIKTL